MRFEDIKGFGAKRIQKLTEAGLTCPADLLMIFPSKYVFGDSRMRDFGEESEAAVIAKCVSEPRAQFVRRNMSLVKATFSDGETEFTATWFNQPFVKKQLVCGNSYALIGKLKKNRKEVYISAYTPTDGQESIVTIYRAYNGIPAKVLKDAIAQVLDSVTVEGRIPDEFLMRFGILPLNACIRALHRPTGRPELVTARENAALQILAYNIAVFLKLKGSGSNAKTHKYRDNTAALRKIISSLPFELTDDQKTTLNSVVMDLSSERRMNRLIEGDVGCGKTIVAFLAMCYVAMSGYQAALMAPTEILAQQHFAKALEFFTPLGIKCELLCGSQDRARRSEALFNIETGNASIIIGTHSIFQDAVVFKDLALTIADEQHRFGVEQRGSLENKGVLADSLVMSATPIPRTLALTLYGDLDISVIHSLPRSKAKIFTRFVPRRKEADMLAYVNSGTDKGEKTYIVCPRVDDEESVSAKAKYLELRKKFGDKVGLVHGQMKDEDKNKIMNMFARGEVMILVCTTVIEVGIDVPDAINIIIYDAETYGLSQLHQLRGRVGRGTKDSYCFVISREDSPDDRLKYFIATDSGFELAEYDFRVRGAGDFLGKRQHGSDSIFAGVSVNEELLSRAKRLADALISANIVEPSDSFIKSLTLN